MLFAKAFVSLFSFISNVGRSSEWGIRKYNDPVCSEFTAKQCIYLGVVFAFTYSVSAFITVGNLDLQFFLFFFLFFFFVFFVCFFFVFVFFYAFSTVTRLVTCNFIIFVKMYLSSFPFCYA